MISFYRSKSPMALLETAARILLGGIFIYASWDKILHPAAFAEAIGNYQILPQMWIHPAALLLPWLELVCGISLLSGRMVRGSSAILVVLLIIFIGALTSGAYRGLDIHCGCFSVGDTQKSSFYFDLLRDMVLLAIACGVLYRSVRSARPQCRPS